MSLLNLPQLDTLEMPIVFQWLDATDQPELSIDEKSFLIAPPTNSVNEKRGMVQRTSAGAILYSNGSDVRLNGQTVEQAWLKEGDELALYGKSLKLVSLGHVKSESNPPHANPIARNSIRFQLSSALHARSIARQRLKNAVSIIREQKMTQSNLEEKLSAIQAHESSIERLDSLVDELQTRVESIANELANQPVVHVPDEVQTSPQEKTPAPEAASAEEACLAPETSPEVQQDSGAEPSSVPETSPEPEASSTTQETQNNECVNQTEDRQAHPQAELDFVLIDEAGEQIAAERPEAIDEPSLPEMPELKSSVPTMSFSELHTEMDEQATCKEEKDCFDESNGRDSEQLASEDTATNTTEPNPKPPMTERSEDGFDQPDKSNPNDFEFASAAMIARQYDNDPEDLPASNEFTPEENSDDQPANESFEKMQAALEWAHQFTTDSDPTSDLNPAQADPTHAEETKMAPEQNDDFEAQPFGASDPQQDGDSSAGSPADQPGSSEFESSTELAPPATKPQAESESSANDCEQRIVTDPNNPVEIAREWAEQFPTQPNDPQPTTSSQDSEATGPAEPTTQSADNDFGVTPQSTPVEAESVADVLAKMRDAGDLPNPGLSAGSDTSLPTSDVQNQLPPSSGPGAPQPVAEQADKSNSEPSVQEYMNQLLTRLGSDPSSASFTPVQETKSTQAAPQQPVVELPLEPVNPLTAEEFVPRQSAPEKKGMLEHLRQVANHSTRSDVNKSIKRKNKDLAKFYLAGSGIGLALGAVGFSMSGRLLDQMMLISLGFVLASVFCCFKYFTSRGTATKVDAPKKPENQTGTPAPANPPVSITPQPTTAPQNQALQMPMKQTQQVQQTQQAPQAPTPEQIVQAAQRHTQDTQSPSPQAGVPQTNLQQIMHPELNQGTHQ